MQSKLDKGVEALYPGFDDIKNIPRATGEDKARSVGIYVSFTEGTQITHKGIAIPYHAIILTLKMWYEIYEHQALNINSFTYIKHNDNGLLATFSLAEFVIGDLNLIAGITKVEGKGNFLSFGKLSDIKTIDVHKGICLGTINDSELQNLVKRVTSDGH